MKRRAFLQAAAVAAGASAWPGWLRKAFAEDDCRPSARVKELAQAYRKSAKEGRPLLVFVIPESDDLKWERGEIFGALINYGSDAALALLSVAEIQCATLKDLRTLVPSVTASNPFVVAVETGSIPARVTVVPFDDRPERPSRFRGASAVDVDAAVEERIAWATKSISKALAPSPGSMRDRALALQGKMPDERAAQIPAVLGDPGASLEGFEAIALQAAVEHPDQKSSLTARLAALSRARLRDKRIPGSKWANSHGCGTTIEGEDDSLMIACGMGYVPKKSERFLYFFTTTKVF